MSRLLVIVGCHGDSKNGVPACPFRVKERTSGAGYANDYYCSAVISTTSPETYAKINGYVEWPSELRKPGDFPSFCPLSKNDRGFKVRGKAKCSQGDSTDRSS